MYNILCVESHSPLCVLHICVYRNLCADLFWTIFIHIYTVLYYINSQIIVTKLHTRPITKIWSSLRMGLMYQRVILPWVFVKVCFLVMFVVCAFVCVILYDDMKQYLL